MPHPLRGLPPIKPLERRRSPPGPSAPARPAANEIPLGVAVSAEPGKAGHGHGAEGRRPARHGAGGRPAQGRGQGGTPAPGQGGEHRLPDRLRRELPGVGLPGRDRPQRRGRSSSTGNTSASATPGSASSACSSARSQLTLEGPDPASPEGQQRIAEKGPATIRGILNLIGRKLDLVAEYEDRVPAYVEQMFDRLEASGIIVGWNRDDWDIWTTSIGLDIRIAPKAEEEDESQRRREATLPPRPSQPDEPAVSNPLKSP